MGNCCDPNAPKIYMLNVGGEMIGLSGVEQAFLDVMDFNLEGEQAGEKLLEIIGRRNYIPECAEKEYKWALILEYRKYVLKLNAS